VSLARWVMVEVEHSALLVQFLKVVFLLARDGGIHVRLSVSQVTVNV
jgi:hypothetical protein